MKLPCHESARMNHSFGMNPGVLEDFVSSWGKDVSLCEQISVFRIILIHCESRSFE